MVWTDPQTVSGALPAPDALAALLSRAGVRLGFGLCGGAIARVMDALVRSSIRVTHCRHESGAAFMACEASLQSGRPAVVFTTTGPGFTHAISGLVAAMHEGADVVALVATSPSGRLGRGCFQELAPSAVDLSRFAPPAATFRHLHLGQRRDLVRLASILARPRRGRGRLVVVTAPSDLPNAGWEVPRLAAVRGGLRPVGVPEAIRALEGRRFAILAGFGARRACDGVRRLAERCSALVLTTPRGKGVLPEDHPRWAGVTGYGGHDYHAALRAFAPEVMLALGTGLGEGSTWFDPALVPPRGLVHVDEDPAAFSRAYPDAKTVAVLGDVREVVRVLGSCLPPRDGPAVISPRPVAVGPGPLHPQTVLQSVQGVLLDGASWPVMVEAGNAFAWGPHALRFRSPQFRMSAHFASMGHATCGVVGAAMANEEGRAVAVVGDGAMLMHHEVSTAAATATRAIWVVFNDAAYGMVAHGMRSIGLGEDPTRFPRVDFAALARAVGADGAIATDEATLATALGRARRADGPFVVDVWVDPAVPPPFGARNAALAAREDR